MRPGAGMILTCHRRSVNWNPISTTSKPDQLHQVGTTPSASKADQQPNTGTSAGKIAARPAPSAITACANR